MVGTMHLIPHFVLRLLVSVEIMHLAYPRRNWGNEKVDSAVLKKIFN